MAIVLPPDWGTLFPEAYQPASYFYTDVVDPYRVATAVKQYLEVIFSDADNISSNLQKKLIWKPVLSESRIRIEEGGLEKLDEANFYPAIIVNEGDFDKTGHNVLEDVVVSADSGRMFTEKENEYVEWTMSNTQIFILGKTKTETNGIMQSIVNWMSTFRPHIKRDLNLRAFRLSKGKAAEREPERNIWIGALIIKWHGQSLWGLSHFK